MAIRLTSFLICVLAGYLLMGLACASPPLAMSLPTTTPPSTLPRDPSPEATVTPVPAPTPKPGSGSGPLIVGPDRMKKCALAS